MRLSSAICASVGRRTSYRAEFMPGELLYPANRRGEFEYIGEARREIGADGEGLNLRQPGEVIEVVIVAGSTGRAI